MPIQLRLAACLVLSALALPAAAQESELTTAAFFELPELFQIATLAGAMAMLRHAAAEPAAEPTDARCFALWTDEDVLAVFSAHTREHSYTLPDPFAPTLVAALRARCRD